MAIGRHANQGAARRPAAATAPKRLEVTVWRLRWPATSLAGSTPPTEAWVGIAAQARTDFQAAVIHDQLAAEMASVRPSAGAKLSPNWG